MGSVGQCQFVLAPHLCSWVGITEGSGLQVGFSRISIKAEINHVWTRRHRHQQQVLRLGVLIPQVLMVLALVAAGEAIITEMVEAVEKQVETPVAAGKRFTKPIFIPCLI